MRQALERSALESTYNRVAGHYDLQHGLLTLRTDERGRKLVVRQGVRPGERVLDAGGGTGRSALLAAAAVGPAGHVTVFDLSEGMLEVARANAEQAGLAGRMAFQCGDILHLPFADGSFDALLSTYSLCPLYDPTAGVLELYRVVKPGGRLAAAHSVEPSNPLVRAIGSRVESLVWRFPRLSLGCRPVQTLPALIGAGAEVLFETRIGVPLWPFIVYVVRKPD